MATENDVRAASEKFYSALNRMLNGDAGPLGDIWSHSGTVATMHPIGGREAGWDQAGKRPLARRFERSGATLLWCSLVAMRNK
jgi:hypothetical protein